MMQLEPIVFSDSLVNEFCTLTGDPNPLHTSQEASSSQGFPGLVVNGALTLAVAIGKLYERSPELCNGVILETSSVYREPMLCNCAYSLRIIEKDSYLGGQVREYDCLYVNRTSKEAHRHTIMCRMKSN